MTGTVTSPDLGGIVQEIVGQGGWQSGNNLALVISPMLAGQQFMDWQAYDFSPANAARLTISYETPPATAAPTATATATASSTPTATPTGSPMLTPTMTPASSTTFTPTATFIPTASPQPAWRAYLPLVLRD
jgi:hypothetical protein